jgi:hypothetical protein
MIKYIDLFTRHHKIGLLYTSSTDNIEYEFHRFGAGENITIKSIEEIKTPMCICDVGEVYAIYEPHTF